MPIARRRKRTSQQPAAAASLSTHLPLHVQHLDQRPPTPTVLGDFDTLNSEPGKESGPSGFVTKGLLTMAPTPVYAVSGQKQGAYSKPSRSHTYSSLNSNSSSRSAFSTAMPLAESNMSIQSHLSEASLLSAVISASGLPTMDVMMDQVDRRVAADSQAQLVENAHVGLVAAQISVVDQDLLLEPCSARIETWVN
ncbi:hypothetical protein BGX28_001156 [Mortierella sp. GBA30]|nr:hypothetical protein BGX28_001156 [Mortierella sp. GBA30]